MVRIYMCTIQQESRYHGTICSQGISDEPQILENKIRKALHDISNNKSSGCDGIPIEIMKAAGEDEMHALTILCRKIWDTGEWPRYWKKSTYIPIPKKGDSSECQNNRTIAFISHTSKVMLKIIQNRMEERANAEILDVQGGFRKGRGTRD